MKSTNNPLATRLVLALILICSSSVVRAEDGVRIQPHGLITARADNHNIAGAPGLHKNECGGDFSDDCPPIVSIDYPGAIATTLQVINDRGVIGGQANTSTLAFSFLREPDDERFEKIAIPGVTYTVLWSMNNQADAAGDFIDQNSVSHSFLRGRDGTITEFDIPGSGSSAGQGNFAIDINEEDTTAGDYMDDANVFHVFLRFRDGRVQTFDAAGAGTGFRQGTSVTSTDGLTSQGDIVGGYVDSANVLHGLIRLHNGEVIYFDAPGAGPGGTNPSGINDRLEVAGTFSDQNNVNHGFIRYPSGGFEVFDVPQAGTAAGQGTAPANINAHGDIVGAYFDSSGTAHGFLRYHDSGKITTFDYAEAAGGLFPIFNNRSNAIVGYYLDASGNFHGFLRTP